MLKNCKQIRTLKSKLEWVNLVVIENIMELNMMVTEKIDLVIKKIMALKLV